MQSTALDPREILISIGVREDVTVADFGCGAGVFSLPAATLTQGAVYAIDIRPQLLDVCSREAEHQRIDNVLPMRANLARDFGSDLGDQSVDFVIMRKIISQNKQKNILFREAHRVLAPAGKLLVIGWRSDAAIGPHSEARVDQAQMRLLGSEAGFDAPLEMLLDQQHFGLVFTKKQSS